MIKEKMYEKVQLFKRQGYSISEITSELEIDPKTAAKYYAMEGLVSPLRGLTFT